MKERHAEILKLVHQSSFLTVNELSERIGVSEVTIRKDLNELEKQNLLVRTHGGASALNDLSVPSFSTREYIAEKEKKLIALAAAKLIEEGDSVLIDAGTTTLAVANYLKEKNISIITNSIPLAMNLTDFRGNVSITGGEMLKENMALYGPDTETYLKSIQVNKLIVGTSGVRLDAGLTTSSSVEMSVKKAMIRSAQKVIAVFDHTKFNKIKTYLFADFEDIDIIVTTNKIPDDTLKILQDKQIEVIMIDESFSNQQKIKINQG